ncbi:MAG: translation elongation factor Ts [bacterium]|jgi:elongation factor Ts
MAVSMDLIKQLREETGAGVADCKNALIESNGDVEKAKKILLAKGVAKAAKKLDRTTKEGLISVKNNHQKAVILELGCETDFVARSEKFNELLTTLTNIAFDNEFKDLTDLLNFEYNSKKVEEFIKEYIAIIGENIKLTRYGFLKANSNNQVVFDYLHFNKRIGVIVLVEFEKDFEINKDLKIEFGSKTVFQIASMKPVYVDINSIPVSEIEEQKKLAYQQALNEGKPEHIASKIAEGKVMKIFEDSVLLEQSFFEENTKINRFKDFVKEFSNKLNEKINILSFFRYEIGK